MEQSESISSLAKALFKAHSEIGPVKKTTKNPFFNSMYADLNTVLDAIKKPFADNGLLLIQTTESIDGRVGVTTEIYHVESAEWIKSTFSMTPRDPSNPQNLGSIFTYLRRYAIPGLCMVSSEDDDDGNAAVEKKEEKKEEKKLDAKPADQPVKTGRISAGQTKYLQMLFRNAGYKEDSDKHSYTSSVLNRPVESITDITTKEAHAVIETLQKLLGTTPA